MKLNPGRHNKSSGESPSVERLKRQAAEISTPERLCAELARILRVKQHEVALLQIEKDTLKFLYPVGLRTAGSIPLSGSAVAARTATTRTTMLSNNFAKVQHVRVFEGVRLATSDKGQAEEPTPIQKMMSVPILTDENMVLGVIQISRKGLDPVSAGPDFSSDDLRLLEQAAQIVASLPFMRQPVPAGR